MSAWATETRANIAERYSSPLRRATIGDMVRRQAARDGHRHALISYADDGSVVRLTYLELDQLVNRVAHGLLALGVVHGDLVAVMARNTWHSAVAYLAALRIGAPVTTVNHGLQVGEVARHLDDAEPRVLITDHPSAGLAAEAAAAAASRPIVVTIGDGPGDTTWSDLVEGMPSTEPDVAVSEHDLAMVVYTSGTESTPKGVALTHRALLMSTAPGWVFSGYVNTRDVFLVLAPLHTMAGLGTITTLLVIGATVVLAPKVEPGSVLRIIETECVTNTSQTPTFYRRLVAHPDFATSDLGSLEQAHVYGGPIPRDVVEAVGARAPDLLWATYWGQSEMGQLGIVGFFKTMADVPNGDTRWIGKPVPHLDVRIVDTDGIDADTGEMWCRSPSVMEGYYRNPEATAAVLEDEWLRTGDIVRRDDDGNLFFLDRSKDMIKSGGMNVSSAEVEETIMLHATVAEAAVFAIPDPQWSEAVTAAVVSVDGHEIDPVEIIAFCKERLAGYKVPKEIHVVDELPVDSQGKVLKRELRDLLTDSTQ